MGGFFVFQMVPNGSKSRNPLQMFIDSDAGSSIVCSALGQNPQVSSKKLSQISMYTHF